MKKKICFITLTLSLIFGLSAQSAKNAVAGEWIYSADNYVVELEFDKDGDASIEIRDRSTKFEWNGTWSLSGNEIVFNVKKIEAENKNFGQREERTTKVKEVFRIKYTFSNGKLTISCKDLPEQITNGTYTRAIDD